MESAPYRFARTGLSRQEVWMPWDKNRIEAELDLVTKAMKTLDERERNTPPWDVKTFNIIERERKGLERARDVLRNGKDPKAVSRG